MALRNLVKAFLVFVALFAAASLCILLCSPSTLQANGLAVQPVHVSDKQPGDAQGAIPLELRLKIDPRLLKDLSTSARTAEVLDAGSHQVRYIVHLAPQADLDSVAHIAAVQDRRLALVATLRQTARETQADLLAYLEKQRTSGKVAAYTSYWIFNGLAVTGDLETLLALAAKPEVQVIRADRVHYLPPLAKGQELAALSPSIEWNITKIGADRVWNAYGLRGQGMVVANMDTGVDWTHPALQRKYRGYDPANPAVSRHAYNWFDATGTYPSAPDDVDGHGTHTMGTIVGSLPNGQNQVGGAPEAQWIAVKVFNDEGEAYDSWIHAGFQWILAPTDLDGRNPDPRLAPDVCSNSWGDSDSSDTTFRDDLHAWRMAGIFPAFAIGNEYNGSLAPHSPGTLPDAFAVGATDSRDVIAAWSCRGPSPWNEIKPEVVAPGVDVRSTLPDNKYGSYSGTSMATPHVAAVVALLWQAERQFGLSAGDGAGLTITATEQVITGTAFQPAGVVSLPNNTVGWGRVDAYQAVGSVARGGTFWGRVTDNVSGAGISAATITMVNRRFGGSAQTWTDARGYYTFSVAAGVYDVTATSFYHLPQSATEVEIIHRATTQLDFRLTALPAGRVVGRVEEQDTGQPVTATIRIREHGIGVATDDQGYYVLTLPLGSYTLEALPNRTGHRMKKVTVALDLAEQTVTQDFVLEVSPRILLVDADAWASASEAEYYQRSLESLLYTHDLWVIGSTEPDQVNIPPTTTMQSYDLVVWSQPLSSPGYIGAWTNLSSFLESGKALFISGQDIGYWDEYRGYGNTEYRRYLHASYVQDDSGIREVVGLSEAPWAGISLVLNTADSAANQLAPSEIAPADVMGIPVMEYSGDGCAAIAADDCRGQGYRSVYLAFGLEGAGPEAMRSETLRQALEWLFAPRPIHDVSLIAPLRQAAAAPGQEVTLDFAIINTGVLEDVYELSVQGSRWPAAIWDIMQGQPITITPVLSPCASMNLVLRVTIPEAAWTGQTDTLNVRVTSRNSPALNRTQVMQVTAAMPWRVLSPLPSRRYRLSAVAIDDCRFLVIGGWGEDNEASRATDVYELRSGVWRAMTSKPTATANTAAALLDGRVYVPGGMRGDTRLALLEIYEPATNRWTRGTDLPSEMAGMAVASAQGKLYIFGGSIADGTLVSSTLEYDPATQAWRERAPMPAGPRAYAAAATLGERIYVAGGWPALRTFECYDPASDSWSSLPPLPTGRQALGLAAVDGYIYAVGGGNGWIGLSNVERYDPATDSWVTLSPLSSALRAGTAVAAVAGRIFAVAGTGLTATGNDHEGLAVGSSLADSSLSVDRKSPGAGERLTFAITLRNPGSQSIPQASLRADIPTHTVYVSDSVSGDAIYNPSANHIEWQGNLPPRSSQSLHYQVTVTEGLARGTLIANTAWVNDGRCGEQALEVTATVEAPDLSSSTKAVDKSVADSGDALAYRIELRNVSAITATDVHLMDALPPQVVYEPDSVTGAVYNPALNQIEWSGELPPGAGDAYRILDSDGGGVAFAWIDATQGGISVPGGGDDLALGPFEIGFPFDFYGAQYTQFYINSNGQVLFGSASSAFYNASIPDASAPNNFIAPFWDDLIAPSGTLYYQLLGDAPQRKLVIEWANASRYGGGASLTFEVILYEDSNEILLQYHTLSGQDTDGGSATVGLEDAAGVQGVQYEYNGQGPGYPLHSGLAVLFQPFVGYRIAFRARVVPDLPVNTTIHNIALLTLAGEPQPPLTATTRIRPIDLSLCGKSVDKAVAKGGDTLSYRIELSNVGAVTATGVTLVDVLPEGVTYISGSVDGAVYNPALNRVEWSGELAPGASGDYRWTDSDSGGIAYDWVDATAGGTSVPGGGDDASLGPFNIGFPFQFYGLPYTQFYINTNGQVVFGTGSSAYMNDCIPDPDAPNSFVAAFWDDLVSASGTMYYQLLGDAPRRRLVIEWANAYRLGGESTLTFEVILHEGSNEILLQYHTLTGSGTDGSSATTGIENETGTEGIQYQCNGEGPGYPLHSGLAVLFQPVMGHNVSFQARIAPDLPLNTRIQNEALLTVEGQAQEPLLATTWVHLADLAQSALSVDKAQANAGDRLTYHLVLQNSGNVTVPNASLTDPIPVGTTYVPGTASGGITYNELQKQMEWHGPVFPQWNQIVSFTLQTSPAARHNTAVTNTATLDDGLGHVYTRTAVTVLQSYDLAASDKVMPATAFAGDVLTCTVRVRNTGVVSTSATVSDVVPSGAMLLPGSVWCSSGECVDQLDTVTWQGQVIGQGLVIVRYQMQIGRDVQPGTVLSSTARIRGMYGDVYERSASTTVYEASYPSRIYLPIVVHSATD